ncbi:hypothetical protein GUITHDRAFT_134408 [Guillardia theta CCMP2712]|uniref:Uncharacterized protein n=1 Tax=Guillardia theta (strain CCMP2712) TaxID=905079 RepID=L1JTS6_GUITC|nr:hypothetical protein GUITHDRAFT_134408 [Guillardia theta CCMP2712]EKX51483.1 hypothetical protein GUITHDRAFT_134408 [Guillardia theta CCMP2712]|eukprot:XP_005838463.1 hypothetical protein GUITHDRAFT_134408 [Guillardia theta CCMP2712]
MSDPPRDILQLCSSVWSSITSSLTAGESHSDPLALTGGIPSLQASRIRESILVHSADGTVGDPLEKHDNTAVNQPTRERVDLKPSYQFVPKTSYVHVNVFHGEQSCIPGLQADGIRQSILPNLEPAKFPRSKIFVFEEVEGLQASQISLAIIPDEAEGEERYPELDWFLKQCEQKARQCDQSFSSSDVYDGISRIDVEDTPACEVAHHDVAGLEGDVILVRKSCRISPMTVEHKILESLRLQGILSEETSVKDLFPQPKDVVEDLHALPVGNEPSLDETISEPFHSGEQRLESEIPEGQEELVQQEEEERAVSLARPSAPSTPVGAQDQQSVRTPLGSKSSSNTMRKQAQNNVLIRNGYQIIRKDGYQIIKKVTGGAGDKENRSPADEEEENRRRSAGSFSFDQLLAYASNGGKVPKSGGDSNVKKAAQPGPPRPASPPHGQGKRTSATGFGFHELLSFFKTMPEEEMMQEKEELSDASGCSSPSQGCDTSLELEKRERMRDLRTVFELSADYYELVDRREESLDVIC